jgi:hypothetical protein
MKMDCSPFLITLGAFFWSVMTQMGYLPNKIVLFFKSHPDPKAGVATNPLTGDRQA